MNIVPRDGAPARDGVDRVCDLAAVGGIVEAAVVARSGVADVGHLRDTLQIPVREIVVVRGFDADAPFSALLVHTPAAAAAGDRHQVVLRAVSFEHAGDQVDHVALADRVEVELDARIVLDEPVPFDADFAVAHQRQDRIDVRCFLSLFSGETPRFDERFDGDVVHAVAQTAHGVGGQNVVDQVAVERVALAAVDAAQQRRLVEDRHRMFHLFVERHDFGVDFVGRQGRPGFDAEGRSEYGTLDRDVVRRRAAAGHAEQRCEEQDEAVCGEFHRMEKLNPRQRYG